MHLAFLGANRQVTGSRYLLKVGDANVLIDCGMFQERSLLGRNWEGLPLSPGKVDKVLLTHAHLDHCGLLPRVVSHGYAGPIYCTEPTAPLAELIMLDSAKIQEEDAAYKQRRHEKEGRRGPYPAAPLYTLADAAKTARLLHDVPYGKPLDVTPQLRVVFHDAGHILGSAILECFVKENGKTRRLIFSGDLGQHDKPLVEDPTMLEQADFLVMESTYGDREHGDDGDGGAEAALGRVIRETVERGGNVVIPTFATERAQELIYHLGRLVYQRKIPQVPVFVDSPMAADVTAVFHRYRRYLDDDTRALMDAHEAPLQFPGLRFTRDVDQSKAINRHEGPCVIMAASGMCNAGRIKHHLRHNIERPQSTLLFVGYQSSGTLGRQIVDGERQVRIHGRMYEVRAKVQTLHSLSAHADRAGLLRWVGHFQKRPPRHIYLTHGQEAAALSLAQAIRARHGWEVTVPQYQDVVEL
jgi:metallo-beta-lactamase family protein